MCCQRDGRWMPGEPARVAKLSKRMCQQEGWIETLLLDGTLRYGDDVGAAKKQCQSSLVETGAIFEPTHEGGSTGLNTGA